MSASALAFFADDIRKEDTGKRFIIGLYQDTLRVQQLPVQIPSIVLFVVVRLSGDTVCENLFVDVHVPGGETQRYGGPVTDDHDKDSLMTFELVLKLGPLQITEESNILVEVTLDDLVIPAGSLQIRNEAQSDDQSPEDTP